MSRYYQFYNEQTGNWIRIDLRRDKVKVRATKWWRIHEIRLPTATDAIKAILPNLIAVGVITAFVASMRKGGQIEC